MQISTIFCCTWPKAMEHRGDILEAVLVLLAAADVRLAVLEAVVGKYPMGPPVKAERQSKRGFYSMIATRAGTGTDRPCGR